MTFPAERLVTLDPILATDLRPGLAQVRELVDAVEPLESAPNEPGVPLGLHAVVTLLFAHAGGWRAANAVPAAAATELVQVATVHHARVRNASLRSTAGTGRTENTTQILAGDRCLAKANLLAAEAGPRVLRALAAGLAAAQYARLTTAGWRIPAQPGASAAGPSHGEDGQHSPTTEPGRWPAPSASAQLLAAAARVGTIATGGSDEQAAAAAACGYDLGTLTWRGPGPRPAGCVSFSAICGRLAALPPGGARAALLELAGSLRRRADYPAAGAAQPGAF